jgi:transposase
VKDNLGFAWHKHTLQRMLEPSGILNWRAKSRPELTEAHARIRLAWAIARKNWTLEQWRQYMWSDECSAERGKGGAVTWVFRTVKDDKWKPEFVETYKKSKDLSAMVWGCFWFVNGKIHRSDLYIMDRDFESKKHGYSARSYLEVLDDQMPRCWQPGLIFMQDNASIHTARTVQQWFTNIGIPLASHPAVSPDLNPIEHIWWHLKNWVLKNHPELNQMGNSEAAQQALEEALIEGWNALPDRLFEQCADSMPYRVQAVIKADGWHTKY